MCQNEKRQYSKEFKVNACELVIKDKLKPQVVEEKMGLNVVMLYRWISEYQENGDQAFVGTGHLAPGDAELRKFKRENERLRQENEILKKPQAIKAFCGRIKLWKFDSNRRDRKWTRSFYGRNSIWSWLLLC